MKTETEYSELAQQLARRIDCGTTCGHFISLVKQQGRFALYHKRGHSSWLNRVSGAAHCGCYWLLLDLDNLPESVAYIRKTNERVLFKKGRLTKEERKLVFDRIGEFSLPKKTKPKPEKNQRLNVIQRLERYRKMENAVEDLLKSFPQPCRYDHHGYCQEHFLHEKPCPIGTLKDLRQE